MGGVDISVLLRMPERMTQYVLTWNLSLRLRLSDLTRAEGNIFNWAVYIPPSGNAPKAPSRVADRVYQQLHNRPDVLIFVLGIFNHCKMDYAISGF